MIMELIGHGWKSSEYIQTINAFKERASGSRLFADAVRRLRPQEIATLSAQGNRSSDWSLIRVVEDFSPDNIFDNVFEGKCTLGSFMGKELQVDSGILLPSGIYKSVICDAEIGNECLIFGAGLIANCIVMENCVIYQIGNMVCTGLTCFGNGRSISVGIETGGREIPGYAEITIQIASAIALKRSDIELLSGFEEFVKSYTDACSIPFCIVEPGVLIRNTSRIENCFIGKSCCIDGAILLQNCTILSSAEEPVNVSHGAFVKNSIVQWGCEVTSMSIVDNSVLTEHSYVERHGKVTSSIIGPNTAIAEGEVTASLLGPFIGFHHQALLIAAIWPQGKGNVAYGANVGSNHTSKAPDQEIWCGEGMFFGLGVNIKFPSNFSRAPYSIIATAVCMPPQRVEFPFSLINTPSFHSAQMSPPLNEIFPGWVLYNNIYTVMRNEGKYLKRNKARRSNFTFEVFRPEIVDVMVHARNALQKVVENRDIYTQKEILGLGKNFLTEENRLKAIDSYNFYIEYYCLMALKQRAAMFIAERDYQSLKLITEITDSDSSWEHALKLMGSEGYAQRSTRENLERLVEIREKIAADTERSKAHDDERGCRIIDDYKDVQVCASEDSFVQEMWKQAVQNKKEIEEINSFKEEGRR